MKNLVLTLMLLSTLGLAAEARQLVNLGKRGVALQSYDPVAFFTEHRPVKGDSKYESAYNGAKYWFVSAEHKAMFDQEPSKFEPQFGGYCAYGASQGHAVPVKIEAWQIVNGRLLMQYDLDVRDLFNKNQQGNLKKADDQWLGLVDKLGK